MSEAVPKAGKASEAQPVADLFHYSYILLHGIIVDIKGILGFRY